MSSSDMTNNHIPDVRAGAAQLLDKIRALGADPDDSSEERFEKSLLVTAMALVMLSTALWGLLYLSFGSWMAGLVSLVYSLFTGISLVWIARTHHIRFFLKSQIYLGLFIPFITNFLLGGLPNSSAVVLWALISVLAGLVFFGWRGAVPLWIAFLTMLVITGFLPPLSRPLGEFPPALTTAFYILNIGGVASIVVLSLNYFIREKNKAYRLLRIEQEKAEDLLLNILPEEIAEILKNERRTIADSFDGASILFADLVGFTQLTASMAPKEMVELLNRIFTFFDALVEKYQVEKIRTIGDNYMVAAGVPCPRPDHARALASMALEMEAYIETLPPVREHAIQFRIGINSGPVVGGVIGRKKFVYDIWGDAVNVASRMESHGVAGKIQITQNTYEMIHEDFLCEPRGSIKVKGRGEMTTWFLMGKKANRAEGSSVPNRK